MRSGNLIKLRHADPGSVILDLYVSLRYRFERAFEVAVNELRGRSALTFCPLRCIEF